MFIHSSSTLTAAVRANPGTALGYVSLGIFTLLFAWYTISYLTSPLRRYPGPRLAAWTNWWRFSLALSGKFRIVLKALHDKHGPVVRIGPNLLSLDYPELIRVVYSADQKFRKTSFYDPLTVNYRGKFVANIFTTTDPAEHAQLKRPMVKSFTMNSILAMENIVDNLTANLVRHLDDATSQEYIDLGKTIACYTWDVMSETTFGQRMDYLRHGYDFNGLMGASHKINDALGYIGQVPSLYAWFGQRLMPTGLAEAAVFCDQSITTRRAERSNPEKHPRRNDFLDSFLDAQDTHPTTTDQAVFSVTLTNFLAGADTTLSAIRSIMFLLLTHPPTLQALRAALDAAGLSEPLCAPTADVPTYVRVRAVPYLEAVIRESLRLLSPLGMHLERAVPPGGLTLPTGALIPGGTRVGMAAYVIGRNSSVYGADADTFRPERWLPEAGETAAEHAQRIKKMGAAEFVFGSGARICIGRNLALVEMYKLVAVLVARYDLVLRDEGDFFTFAPWITRQQGLVVAVKRREYEARVTGGVDRCPIPEGPL